MWWAVTASRPAKRSMVGAVIRRMPASSATMDGGCRRRRERPGPGNFCNGPGLTYLSGKNSRKAGTIRWLTNSQDDPSLNSRPVTR